MVDEVLLNDNQTVYAFDFHCHNTLKNIFFIPTLFCDLLWPPISATTLSPINHFSQAWCDECRHRLDVATLDCVIYAGDPSGPWTDAAWLIIVGSLILSTVGHVVIRVSGELLQSVSAAHAARGSRSAAYKAELKSELKKVARKKKLCNLAASKHYIQQLIASIGMGLLTARWAPCFPTNKSKHGRGILTSCIGLSFL